LPVRVTVTDRVSGPNGYVVKITEAKGVAMAWDATRERFYLSVPDPTFAERAHSVVAFDPTAGHTTATAPVTSHPGALAISRDGAFLYVAPVYPEGQLERLRLPDLAADLSTRLIDSCGGACGATDVAVAPARPTVIAVGCEIHGGGLTTTAVVIFDGTTLRGSVDGTEPRSWLDVEEHFVAWGADTSRVFASSRVTPTLYDISVGATGVSVTNAEPAPTRGGVQLVGGLLYADNGSMVDPATFDRVASLVPRREGTDGVPLLIAVDSARNRAFAIALFNDLVLTGRGPMSLVSFDLAERSQIASIPLDSSLVYADLLRFGQDGLAVLAQGKLILVNGAFVAP
jgi:DNA-binding beta-propeller fold protein YncE